MLDFPKYTNNFQKSFVSKETYGSPWIKILQKYVIIAKPNNSQQNTYLWSSRFEEFVKDTQPDAVDLLILYDKKVIAMLLCESIVVIKTRDKKEYKANSLYNEICIINRFYQEIVIVIENYLRDILHTRMIVIELEEINNGDYDGADPLADEKMARFFEHPILIYHIEYQMDYCSLSVYHNFPSMTISSLSLSVSIKNDIYLMMLVG
nr:7285_t:CDS:1 [Entrophospora candida]